METSDGATDVNREEHVDVPTDESENVIIAHTSEPLNHHVTAALSDNDDGSAHASASGNVEMAANDSIEKEAERMIESARLQAEQNVMAEMMQEGDDQSESRDSRTLPTLEENANANPCDKGNISTIDESSRVAETNEVLQDDVDGEGKPNAPEVPEVEAQLPEALPGSNQFVSDVTNKEVDHVDNDGNVGSFPDRSDDDRQECVQENEQETEKEQNEQDKDEEQIERSNATIPADKADNANAEVEGLASTISAAVICSSDGDDHQKEREETVAEDATPEADTPEIIETESTAAEGDLNQDRDLPEHPRDMEEQKLDLTADRINKNADVSEKTKTAVEADLQDIPAKDVSGDKASGSASESLAEQTTLADGAAITEIVPEPSNLEKYPSETAGQLEDADASGTDLQRIEDEEKAAEEVRIVEEKAEELQIVEEKAAGELRVVEAEESRVAEEKTAEELRVVEAEELRVAEEKAAEELRVVEAEESRIAEEKAEESRIAEEKAAEELRMAEEKAAEELRVAEQKAAEELRVVEAEELRIVERKAEEELRIAEEKAEESRIAEEKAAEEVRVVEQKAEESRIAKEKAEEELRIAEEKAAEELRVVEAGELRIAEEKAAEELRIAEEKAAEELRVVEAEELRVAEEKDEEQRIAEEKAEESRIAEEKAAEELRMAEEKAAEELRVAEQKAAEELRVVEQKAEESRIAKEKAEEELRIAEESRIAEEKAAEELRVVEEQAADTNDIPLEQASEEPVIAATGEGTNVTGEESKYENQNTLTEETNISEAVPACEHDANRMTEDLNLQLRAELEAQRQVELDKAAKAEAESRTRMEAEVYHLLEEEKDAALQQVQEVQALLAAEMARNHAVEQELELLKSKEAVTSSVNISGTSSSKSQSEDEFPRRQRRRILPLTEQRDQCLQTEAVSFLLRQRGLPHPVATAPTAAAAPIVPIAPIAAAGKVASSHAVIGSPPVPNSRTAPFFGEEPAWKQRQAELAQEMQHYHMQQIMEKEKEKEKEKEMPMSMSMSMSMQEMQASLPGPEEGLLSRFGVSEAFLREEARLETAAWQRQVADIQAQAAQSGSLFPPIATVSSPPPFPTMPKATSVAPHQPLHAPQSPAVIAPPPASAMSPYSPQSQHSQHSQQSQRFCSPKAKLLVPHSPPINSPTQLVRRTQRTLSVGEMRSVRDQGRAQAARSQRAWIHGERGTLDQGGVPTTRGYRPRETPLETAARTRTTTTTTTTRGSSYYSRREGSNPPLHWQPTLEEGQATFASATCRRTGESPYVQTTVAIGPVRSEALMHRTLEEWTLRGGQNTTYQAPLPTPLRQLTPRHTDREHELFPHQRPGAAHSARY
jgi:hypothetical protein